MAPTRAYSGHDGLVPDVGLHSTFSPPITLSSQSRSSSIQYTTSRSQLANAQDVSTLRSDMSPEQRPGHHLLGQTPNDVVAISTGTSPLQSNNSTPDPSSGDVSDASPYINSLFKSGQESPSSTSPGFSPTDPAVTEPLLSCADLEQQKATDPSATDIIQRCQP